MNPKWVLLTVLTGCAIAQTSHSIDWKPCQDVVESMQAKAEQFNNSRTDGLVLQVNCLFEGKSTRKKQPEKHVALTQKEIDQHHHLKEIENAAFKVTAAYEKYLIREHYPKGLDIGDPCYYFVGFVLDQDYITIDPNPMDPTCE